MALALYRTACKRNHPPACAKVAEFLDQGKGVKKDPVEALRLYRLACDAKEWNACTVIGARMLNGKDMPKNIEEGNRLIRGACEHGVELGCVSIILANSPGSKTPIDCKLAIWAAEQSCAYGTSGLACVYAANQYQKGGCVDTDETKAYSLYQHACQLGFQSACGIAPPNKRVGH